jgi:putative drug exporter of the RND superfamily
LVGSAGGGGSTGSSAGGLPGGSAGRARAVVVHHRWTIIALAVVFTALAGLFGADVQSHLKSGGFEDPRSESSRAEALLEETFGSGAPDVLLVVTAADGNVDDPAVAAAAGDLVDWIATQPNVEQVVDYWRLGNPPPLRSDGGDRALVFVRLSGSEDDRIQAAGALRHATQEQVADGAIQVGVGGEFATYHELNEIIEEDLLTAEMIALPITLILLVIVFGSVAAALLPLAIGGISIVGTFLVLTVIAGMTDVSIFSLNFTTAMGLGLSIDYSLLVVSRFREELAGGHPVNDAVWRTVRTAGRTVLFSALTVASSLVALLVFTQYFLRSFAYAGIAVVGLAAVGAVVVLPAILAVVGHNVNRWQVRRPSPVADDQGRWYRLAMVVMRRPIPIATAGLLFLLVLGAPFLRVELGFPDERVLPPEATTREVGEILRLEFNAAEATPDRRCRLRHRRPAGTRRRRRRLCPRVVEAARGRSRRRADWLLPRRHPGGGADRAQRSLRRVGRDLADGHPQRRDPCRRTANSLSATCVPSMLPSRSWSAGRRRNSWTARPACSTACPWPCW